MTTHKPTVEECNLIRECARKDARRSRFEIFASTRYNLSDATRDEMNVALVSSDPEFGDTDLADNSIAWANFRRGFPLADGGRAIVDFWVYGTGRAGELETNVTAYWEGGRLVRVQGTNGVCLTPEAAP